MGGPATIIIDTHARERGDAERLLAKTGGILGELEARYSRYRPDSVVSLINERAGTNSFTPTDPELKSLLEFVTRLWNESDGLFDPTVGVLNNVWDFRTGHPKSVEKLDSGFSRVPISGSQFPFPRLPGRELNG